MNRTRVLSLAVAAAAAGVLGSGCVVETSCTDTDGDGICDVDEGCTDANHNGICDVNEGGCPDVNANGICDQDEDCTDANANGICDEDECVDANANGICDDEEGCVDENANGICDIDEGVCTFDDDLDGICWEDDCNDLDASIGFCDGCVDDMDCDGESDLTDCYDDFQNLYVCAEQACTIADNYCADSWYIVYCVDDVFYGADCQTACTTDDATWSQACAAPALAGECGEAEGACLCWCEDSFDSCVNDFTVQYTREGTTYQVDCKEYCGGTCDAATGSCACP